VGFKTLFCLEKHADITERAKTPAERERLQERSRDSQSRDSRARP